MCANGNGALMDHRDRKRGSEVIQRKKKEKKTAAKEFSADDTMSACANARKTLKSNEYCCIFEFQA